MIKKNDEQFDSGGVILKHTFLLEFNRWNLPPNQINEDMVNELVNEKTEEFKSDFKTFLMFQLGYVGKEGDVWIKDPKTN